MKSPKCPIWALSAISLPTGYQWALGAVENGDFEAARDLFTQTLDLAPTWAPGWFALAEALERLDRREEASEAFRQAQRHDPEGALGASLHLARLDAAPTPAAAPPGYVKALFDQYAATFDKHLVEKLAYRGPELLLAAIDAVAPHQKFAAVLDLGCGAGLAGAAIRARATNLTGVDLSPLMIEQARGKAIYDRLAVAEIVDFLQGEPQGGADLILAADVFVYIGDLAPVFAAAAQALAADGLFAFTVQRPGAASLELGAANSELGAAGFELGADMRYAHSAEYLRLCAEKTGFAEAGLLKASTRKDRGADVPGLVALFRRKSPPNVG